MSESNCYQETWDSMSWLERGRFLVNYCPHIQASSYLAFSRLNWNELPKDTREILAFEFFCIGSAWRAAQGGCYE